MSKKRHYSSWFWCSSVAKLCPVVCSWVSLELQHPPSVFLPSIITGNSDYSVIRAVNVEGAREPQLWFCHSICFGLHLRLDVYSQLRGVLQCWHDKIIRIYRSVDPNISVVKGQPRMKSLNRGKKGNSRLQNLHYFNFYNYFNFIYLVSIEER